MTVSELDIPPDGWKPIKEAFLTTDIPKFNNGHIVTYFVTRCVIDGLPSENFKSASLHAINLFKCGHVQSIEVCTVSSAFHLRAICQPEMKKNKLYKLNLVLNSNTLHIMSASCGYPAGKGPNGSCKHIGAFCYAFENFCMLGSTPDFLTCTDILQSWNQPRGPKVDPIPVEMLSARRNEIFNKADKSSVVFDPRPKQFQNCNPNAVEKLRCDLLNKCVKGNAAFLTILVPSVVNIAHDHTYASKPKDIEDLTDKTAKCEENEGDGEDKECCSTSDECLLTIDIHTMTAVAKLCLSSSQREDLERLTRKQSDEDLWHDARRNRITGSKCGRILTQKKRTVALLYFVLYPKPFQTTPKPIEWGRRKESLAREAYVEYMKVHGHLKIQAEVCGLFVHPIKGWLAASPDAQVYDPDVPLPWHCRN